MPEGIFLHSLPAPGLWGWRSPRAGMAMGSRRGNLGLVFSEFSFFFWSYSFELLASPHFFFKEHYSESNILSRFLTSWKYILLRLNVTVSSGFWITLFFPLTLPINPLKTKTTPLVSQMAGPLRLQFHFLDTKQRRKSLFGFGTPHFDLWKHVCRLHVCSHSVRLKLAG